MKKLILALFGLVVILVVAIMAAPMFYDVDAKLRPEIEKMAAQSINGTLKIGKMKLNLWTGVNIEIDGIDLKEQKANSSFVKAEKAQLKIPFGSLLSGNIKVDIGLTKPTIKLTKLKNGKFNFESLIKANPATKETSTVSGNETNGGTDLSLLNKLDLNLTISEADLSYSDLQTKFKTSISGFNFELTNLGFGKDIGLKINTNLDLSPSKDIKTKGSLSLSGITKIDWGNSGFSALSTDLEVDLSQLDAKVRGLVNKKAGVPLKLETKLILSPNSLNIEQLDFIVNDLKLSALGLVKSFKPLEYNLELNSTMMDLAEWRKIVVPIGQYGLGGRLSLGLKISGKEKALNYSGNLSIVEGGMNVPGVKNPLTALRTNIIIKNELLKIKELSGVVGSSSFNINGQLNSFTAPVINLGIYSPNISASDFISPLTNEEKQAKIEAAKMDQPELTEEQIQKMVMGPIEQLKQIPILKKLKLNANVKVDKLYYENIEAQNFVSDISYAKYVFRLNKVRMDAFGGKAALVTAIDIRNIKPKYNLKAKIAGIDTVAFTKSLMPELAGSLTGRLAADFTIGGTGSTKNDLKKFLKGKGGFKLEDGTWSGLKAMQMVGEKLSSIKGAKKEASKVKIGNKFQKFEGKFNIASGKFNLTNFIMDFTEAKSAIIGRGYVDFDMNANMVASILAPLDNVPKKIRYKDGRAELPIEITGKITSPKIGWEKMLRKVLGAYAENKAKKEIKKKVDQEVQKLLKSKKAKDLMKKLGF